MALRIYTLHSPLFLLCCALRYSSRPNEAALVFPNALSLLLHLFSSHGMLLFPCCLSKSCPGFKVQARSDATLLQSSPPAPWLTETPSPPALCTDTPVVLVQPLPHASLCDACSCTCPL